MVSTSLTAREKRVSQQFTREHLEQTRFTREALGSLRPLPRSAK